MKLKELRKNKNKTQEEVAKALNLSRSSYGHYELGERQPDYKVLVKLADYFEVSIDYLLGRELTFHPIKVATETTTIPIRIIGEGSCGLGSNNQDYVTSETLDVPNSWIKGSMEEYFIVTAKGDSMQGSNIVDNSLLLFKRQENLENGQIGAFSLNGEEYIKKFYRHENGIVILKSTNIDYEEIFVTEHDDFRVIGVLKKNIISY